jgi:CRISPR-associated protein Csx10
MRYIACVTNDGPLSFRTGRETVNVTTLPYVPGTTLLGGLAEAHTLLRHDVDQFNAFFLGQTASFGNLYPASFKPEALQGDTDPVYPLPATARTCKRFGGFASDEDDPKDEPHHGVFDALIPWVLFALSGETHTEALDGVKNCPYPRCEAPLDRFDGFYRRSASSIRAIGKAGVERGLRTRTGIHRATGTVRQGILYSREVLRTNMTFWGTLTVPDAQAQAFDQFVQEANESGLLHLGNNRTRGLGRVTLKLKQAKSQDSTETLGQRIHAFDAELRRRALALDIPTPHAVYLPLTLLSDAILFDRLLRYRGAIEPDYLAEVWGLSNADLVYQNSGDRRVMGWSNLWRLPKPDDVAITKGSVFVFGLSRPFDDDVSQLLLRMQDEGIGARRREGFGRLQVANPFHWEVKGA